MGNITVTIESSSVDGKSSCPVDTSFWKNIWEQYTTEFTELIIHCWMEEQEVVDELGARAVNVINEGLMKVFTINLSEDNRLFFCNYSIDPKGGLKWFKMFFHVNGDERLEIGHYGSEITLYNVDKEKATEFSALFPRSSISNFHDDYEE